MGVRLGIDVIEVAQVAAAIDTHRDRYLTRVYTQAEVADCRRADGVVDPERLAARFAAKEAVRKALRCPGGVAWTEVETVRRADGAPQVALHGATARRAREQGVGVLSVSLTHDAGIAAAVVAGEVVA